MATLGLLSCILQKIRLLRYFCSISETMLSDFFFKYPEIYTADPPLPLIQTATNYLAGTAPLTWKLP